jgi:hypothetical protein
LEFERNYGLMNQNRLYAGVAIFAALLVVLGISVLPSKKQLGINQRSPISSLGYCNADVKRPCVVSFSLDSNGNMLVNLLMPADPFPNFYLKITDSRGDSRYKCRRAQGFSTTVYCTGEEMHPGEELQFVLASMDGDAVLAEGSFSIVGLALATPAEALDSPTPSSTPEQLTGTPGTPRPTPSLTSGTPPSYPNPYP